MSTLTLPNTLPTCLEPPNLCDCGAALRTADEQQWGACRMCLDSPLNVRILHPGSKPSALTIKPKIKATAITLKRAEGMVSDCVRVTITRADGIDGDLWRAANRLLADWALTAPIAGYHKVDFLVEYADGERIPGRLDLDRNSDGRLDTHIAGLCLFLCGLDRRWLSHERYAELTEQNEREGIAERYQHRLECYEIGTP